MRTKLVLGAAVLAAGLVTTMAQVYSLNIVGYVNVPTPSGFSFLSNPLDNGANDGNTLFPNPDPTQDYSGPYDSGCSIQTWTGTGWKPVYFDSVTTDTTTGFMNASQTAAAPAPILGSGQGFLFYSGGPPCPTNVTFVGTVRQGTGTSTSYTNSLALPTVPTPYSLGSMLPLGGGVQTALGFANPGPLQTYDGPLDSANIQILQIVGGQSAGYRPVYFDSVTTDTTTGFMNASQTAPAPEPQIPAGGGFIFANSGSSYNWVQILNP